MQQSLQDIYAPEGICYGCGPTNTKGFQIKSFVKDSYVIAHWQPKPEHQAYPNVLNGGVVGTLLDCHCNAAAGWSLMQFNHLKKPPCTVTAEYTIKLLKPTPIDQLITLEAQAEKVFPHKAIIFGKLKVHDT